MTDPATYTFQHMLGTIMIAIAGCFTGDIGVIVMGAVGGALWPVCTVATSSRKEAVLLLFKLVATALALTGAAVHLLEVYHGIPPARSTGPAAFCIAVAGNRWLGAVDAVADGAKTIFKAAVRGAAGSLSRQAGEER